jgi:hypothetical protein
MSDDAEIRPDDPDDETPPPDALTSRRPFALVLVGVLAVWKIYEAIAAATVHATIAPSLYLLGLGSFAVSLLGPRRLQVPTFFAGAVLCLAAIGVETRS